MESQQLIEEISIKLSENVIDIESFNKWKKETFTMINKIVELKKCSISFHSSETSSSLDPADWPLARCTAHEMLDSSLDFLEEIRTRPVWNPIPNEIRSIIENETIPEEGQTLSNVCREVLTNVMPYNKGNPHPRYWGWVSGEGTLGGVLSDMISSTLNINTCSGTHSGLSIEKTVIKWMCQLFGFPSTTSGGLLTSGTSMATIISIAAARQQKLSHIRQNGLINGHQLVGYASIETHECLVKAFELLGLGSQSLRLISVDQNCSIDIQSLKQSIQNDRNNGLIPFCLVGNAGTVKSGSFDNLVELSSIAHSEQMWFHVDGAFGSFIRLDDERRSLVSGIDQADSLVFDFHKWLHCPFDAGCVLVRQISNLQSTFSTNHSYLKKSEHDCSINPCWYFDLGPELSRSFRALKVWFTIKEHGIKKLGRKINENCQQAQYLTSLLDKSGHFIRIFRPVLLNIVNFRFQPDEFNETDFENVNKFNEELLLDIQSTGFALPSSILIENYFYIRIAIVSHRTIQSDLDQFVNILLNLYEIKINSFRNNLLN